MTRNWKIEIIPEGDNVLANILINGNNVHSSEHSQEIEAIQKVLEEIRKNSMFVDGHGEAYSLNTVSICVKCGENVEVIKKALENLGSKIVNGDYEDTRTLIVEVSEEAKIEPLKRLARALGALDVD